ncbi:t-snare [Phaffia rhodozyma]|uniref:T-snare n=1 Tax=Phaffia rhodozyma TaxID=264483 RepID=A0A0F7SH29_PHARH|nr:t-snare [Phaffia rhodozyma]
MSFNDLERGVPLTTTNASSSSNQEFDKLQSSLSLQIFKINANVKGIDKLLLKLNGANNLTSRNVRDSLSGLLDSTREIVKHSSSDLKKFTAFPPSPNAPNRKALQTKLSREYQTSISAFQKIQRIAADKQRLLVEDQRKEVNEETTHLLDLEEQGSSQELQQQQQERIQVSQIPAHELEFQEAQIAEREVEIREIESGIHELNEIFRDLGTIVVEQGGMIDNIESNITSVERHTSAANQELSTAHEYQKKAGRRMLWLMLILLIVSAIVLTAILS